MLYLQSWHCRLLLIRKVKGEQQRMQQCSLNFCCLERMLHLLPSSSNFCFISLEWKKQKQIFSWKSSSSFHIFCYTLQITFEDVKWIWEMHILNLELERKKFLCSLKPPMANSLKLSLSQTRVKFTRFQRDNPKESQVAAPGTPAVPNHRRHVKI